MVPNHQPVIYRWFSQLHWVWGSPIAISSALQPGLGLQHESKKSAPTNLSLKTNINKILSWLVVLTILKNMKVNGKDYPIYFIYYGKEKMFGTTNQLCMMILPFKNDDSQRPKATSLEMLVSDWKFSLPSLVAWLLWMDCFEGTPTLNRESVVFTTIRKKKKVFLQFFLQFFPSTETLLRPEEISCEYMF